MSRFLGQFDTKFGWRSTRQDLILNSGVPTPTPASSAQQPSNDRLFSGDIIGSRASSESTRSSISLRAILSRLFDLQHSLPMELNSDELNQWALIQPKLSSIKNRLCLEYEQSISYEPRKKSTGLIAMVVCSDKSLQRLYQSKLDGSPQIREYVGRLGWTLDVVTGVKRAGSVSNASFQESGFFASSLGTGLLVHPEPHDEQMFLATVGCIVLLNGRPYGLTTAHGICSYTPDSDGSMGTSQDLSASAAARVAHYRFSHRGPRRETYGSGSAGDWALVELDDRDILPNFLALDAKRLGDSSDTTLWKVLQNASVGEDPAGPLLISEIMGVEEYSSCASKRAPQRLACLAVTSASVIPGLLDLGTATLDFGGTNYTVVRICLADPIGHGDSGSWVFVQGRLFGTIVAIRTEPPNEETVEDNSDEAIRPVLEPRLEGSQWAYVIPIEDTFHSIAATLSATVKLPDLNDWRLRLLDRQRKSWRWSPMSDRVLKRWLPRHLDAERLFAEKKANEFSTERGEDVSNSVANTLSPAVSMRLGRRSRLLLDIYSQIRAETLDSLLHLGDVCPLSPALRAGFRRWLTPHMESGLYNRNVWAASSIVKAFTTTEAGENVLGLFFILWKTQRSTRPQGVSKAPERLHRTTKAAQSVWFANLLSTLLRLLKVPPSEIPSSEQLVRFVRCIVESFRNKDLDQLHFVMDGNTLAREATPADQHWSAIAPRLSEPRTLRSPFSYFAEKLGLRKHPVPVYELDEAYRDLQPDEWYHDVTSTARLLLQLRQIALGDGSDVLVCTGQWARWAGFYAAVVLGLEVDFRQRLEDEWYGSVPWPSPFRAAGELLRGPVGIVAYLDPRPIIRVEIPKSASSPTSTGAAGVCEIIKRNKVAPVPMDLTARFARLDDQSRHRVW